MVKKRGRKAGSGSFMQVSLEELNRVLKPGARVVIWGRYGQMLGLNGKKVGATQEELIAAVSGGTSDVAVTTFGTEIAKAVAKSPLEELVPKPEMSFLTFS